MQFGILGNSKTLRIQDIELHITDSFVHIYIQNMINIVLNAFSNY
jgi:hypothetical protein